MKKTVDHAKMRETLLDATVDIVASFGLEGCTSKKIAARSGLNEAYIFRYFFDLRDIRKTAFFRTEDHILRELASLCEKYPEGTADRNKKIFLDFWHRLLSDKRETLFYLRYFLSTECRGEILEAHLTNCENFLRGIGVADENIGGAARVGSAVLLTVFQYASFVHCRVLDDTEDVRELVFRNVL